MFELDLVAERARVTPRKLAVVSVESGERLTYAQLDARVSAAAGMLLRAVAPGDRVGLLAYNCIEFLEIFFGAIRAGIIVVPLSTRSTAHELTHIVRDCDMRLLIHGPEFEAVAGEAGIPSRSIHEKPTVGNLTPRSTILNPGRHDPESIACLLYTSGTTGKPKGVMIPRRQLWWNGYNTAINWGLRDDDVTPVFTPLYHAGGLAAFMIPIFCAGGTVVVHKTFDAAEVWRTFEQERCTVALGVPTIWKLLMEAPEFATVDLSHVRWVISGGAPLPHFIIEAYQRRGIVFKQGYGMTEVGVNCFTMTVEESFAKPGSIGRPMLFTEVKLAGADGETLGDGEIGEMWIRGPHVSKGYWNNEAATREAYTADGWLKTGDLARRDDDGFFYIAGRRKEMFISGGVNVYPAEIEAALVAHLDVTDAAVIAVADETWGEVGVAFVVASTDEAELVRYLEERLSKYKVPKRFVVVDTLPRSAYGKVLKEELRKRLS